MMSVLEMPNWLRVVFVALSALSFLPQLGLLWVRRDSSGINLYYVLFNTIVATEHFTISFFLTVNHIDQPVIFVHHPPTLGDRLNLVQLTVIWLLWLVVLAACLVLPATEGHSSRPAKKVWTLYASFLAISVIPIFVDAIFNPPSPENPPFGPREMWGDIFFFIHMTCIHLPVTACAFAALLYQRRAILIRPDGPGTGSLSLLGLGLQAVIFSIFAITWPWRLSWSWAEFDPRFLPQWIYFWYQMVGFLPVDHAVFAYAQGYLLWTALRHARTGRKVAAGEAEPLLHGELPPSVG